MDGSVSLYGAAMTQDPDTSSGPQRIAGPKQRIYIELAILAFVSLFSVLLAGEYDLLETLLKWAENYEHYEVDEILTLAFVLAIAFAIFSWRRSAELRQEIGKRSLAEENMRHMAMHDAMTGLPNRTLFVERLAQELDRAQRDNSIVALFALDIDMFKRINDVYGHAAGDALLVETAQRLTGAARRMDTIARLGGDEFAIIMPNQQELADASAFAARIVQAFDQPFNINGHEFVSTISVGVAISSREQNSLTELLRAADVALYRSKAEGRSTYRFFDAMMDQPLRQRQQIEIGLREALREQQFELYFQPLFSIPEQELTGFEALIRWNHPELGRIMPDQFISIAEELGLIHEIGDWVLQEACRVALTWEQPLTVAVNVSPIQFKQGNLDKKINSLVTKSGLPPDRLEIEITENALLDDAEAVLAVLQRLKDSGIHISMDDFGTGYSSLSYLRKFPFDKIKIDRSFFRELEQNQGDVAIVRAVAAMGESLGMTTLAEGIETEKQLAQLSDVGCAAAQGFLLGHPMTEKDVNTFIEDHGIKSSAVACSDANAAG